MPKISDPLQIGPMLAKNRFAHRPMYDGAADPMGYVVPRMLEAYRRIAAGGYALVTVQATAIHPTAYIGRNHSAIFDDSYISGQWELADAIKREGALAGLQLFGAGSLSNPAHQIHIPPDKRWVPAPSDTPADWSYHGKPTRTLTEDEVSEFIGCYASGARRARVAEYDYVMLHATHGSLPMQFMSPRWNLRTDKWADRKLFIQTTIKEVRKAIGPKVALSVNVSATEAQRPPETAYPGYDQQYLYDFIVPTLLETGEVDWIDITAGSIAHYWGHSVLLGSLYWDQGYMIKYAREVKRLYPQAIVGVPGKIMDPRMAERIVEEGWADIVGLGRPSWADPDYPKKALAGRYEDVRQCNSCGWCYARVYFSSLCTCAVNPVFHREHQGWEYLPPVQKPKRILIAGGGVAGMEFARVAQERGHDVVLYEKKDRVGGQTNIASDIPYVDTMDLDHTVTWQRTQLEKLGVEIHLGTEVTMETLEREAPDVLVVATGSVPVIPDIPGVDLPHVMTVDRYLEEKPELEGTAVVLGSWEPAETALSLARQEVQTTVVSDQPEGVFGKGIMGARYFWSLYDRRHHLLLDMADDGVKIIYDAQIDRITPEGVEVTREGRTEVLPADTVILGWGRRSVSELAQQCQGIVPEIYILGDAVKPANQGAAVEDGYRWARRV